MNDTTESLVIEILCKLQGEMSILREDIRDIKARLSSIEARLGIRLMRDSWKTAIVTQNIQKVRPWRT
jgi:hypothetical protein